LSLLGFVLVSGKSPVFAAGCENGADEKKFLRRASHNPADLPHKNNAWRITFWFAVRSQ